jgi:hypothetical protein
MREGLSSRQNRRRFSAAAAVKLHLEPPGALVGGRWLGSTAGKPCFFRKRWMSGEVEDT